MCAGFFLIAALEEAIHHLLQSASTSEAKEGAKEGAKDGAVTNGSGEDKSRPASTEPEAEGGTVNG